MEPLMGPGGVGFSVDHVTYLLKVDLETLARQSGIAEDQLCNEPSSEAVQAYLATVVSVLLAAYFVSNDLDKAVEWYRHSPLFNPDPRTAEAYVSAGRADAVLAYLQSIESGPTG